MPITEISSTCVHVYTNFFPYPLLFLVGLTAVCKLRSWLVEQKQGKAVWSHNHLPQWSDQCQKLSASHRLSNTKHKTLNIKF